MPKAHKPISQAWGKMGGALPMLDFISIGGDSDSQYSYDQVYGQSTQNAKEGEKGLMLAIMELAVERDIKDRRYRNQALRWIKNNSTWGVFSFNYICQSFGMDPSAARRAILRKAEKKSAKNI